MRRLDLNLLPMIFRLPLIQGCPQMRPHFAHRNSKLDHIPSLPHSPPSISQNFINFDVFLSHCIYLVIRLWGLYNSYGLLLIFYKNRQREDQSKVSKAENYLQLSFTHQHISIVSPARCNCNRSK